MTNVRTLRRLAVALVLLVAAIQGSAAAAPAAGPTPHRVLVGREGFRQVGPSGAPLPNGLQIKARAGERLAITFVYADTDLDYDNPHIIYFPGLDLKTAEIGRSHPEETLTFVAGQGGRLELKCVRQCNGHRQLQDGVIEVTEGAVAQPTRMRLQASPEPGGLRLQAQLDSEAGIPVAGARIAFVETGAFLGRQGIRLGEAAADASGKAQLLMRPRREGETYVQAVYSGSGTFLASRATAMANVPGAAVVRYHQESPDLHLPVVGNWLLWLVVAGVWTTYAMAVWQAVRIPGAAMAGAGGARIPVGPGGDTMVQARASDLAARGSARPGGASVWQPATAADVLEAKRMDSWFGKLAVGLLALLMIVTWGVGSYRFNVERATRLAAEGEIRGNLATVARGLGALQDDFKPMLAQQKAAAESLAQVAAGVPALQSGMAGLRQQVDGLQTQVKAAQAASAASKAAPAAVPPAAPAAATTATSGAGVVEVKMSGYHFGWDPARVEVRKGDKVRLVVTNDGKRLSPGLTAHPTAADENVHGLGIAGYGIDREIRPGATEVIEFTADKAGEFKMECTVWCGMLPASGGRRLSHQDMTGTLIVR